MAAPTIVFACGGECASIGAHWYYGPYGPVTRSTAVKYSGAASIKVAAAGAAAYVGAQGPDTSPRNVIHFVIYLDGLPNADCVFFRGYSHMYDMYVGFDHATSKLCVWSQGQWANRVLGPVLVTATHTIIDLLLDQSADINTISWRVDGVAQTTYSHSHVASTLYQFHVGQTGEIVTATYTAYIDDFALSDTAADYPFAAGHVTGTTTEVWTVTPAGVKPNFIPFFWA